MKRMIYAALLAAGAVLALFGFNEMNSATSDISRMFTGAPTDRAIWMLAGGAALAVFGVLGLLSGARRI